MDLQVARAESDFRSTVMQAGLRRFGRVANASLALSWNVRFSPVPHFGPNSLIRQALDTFQPVIAGLMECPRFEIPRGVLEPDETTPYRFVVSPHGGDQRFVLAYDVRRARLKGRVASIEGPFRRPPMWAHFSLIDPDRLDPIDLQVVVAHFKSPGGGYLTQRRSEAEALATWIKETAAKRDADLLVLADFNSPAYEEDLDYLLALERSGLGNLVGANGSEEVGFMLSSLRERPPPEHVVGECYLDQRFVARSCLGPPSRSRANCMQADLATFVPQDTLLSSFVAECAKRKGGENFAPQLCGFYFREFEEDNSAEADDD